MGSGREKSDVLHRNGRKNGTKVSFMRLGRDTLVHRLCARLLRQVSRGSQSGNVAFVVSFGVETPPAIQFAFEV